MYRITDNPLRKSLPTQAGMPVEVSSICTWDLSSFFLQSRVPFLYDATIKYYDDPPTLKLTSLWLKNGWGQRFATPSRLAWSVSDATVVKRVYQRTLFIDKSLGEVK